MTGEYASCLKNDTDKGQLLKDAGMAQWWEHLPPIVVVRVRFLVVVSRVGWLCWWLLSLLQRFYSGSSGFPPTTKTNILNFSSI